MSQPYETAALIMEAACFFDDLLSMELKGLLAPEQKVDATRLIEGLHDIAGQMCPELYRDGEDDKTGESDPAGRGWASVEQ